MTLPNGHCEGLINVGHNGVFRPDAFSPTSEIQSTQEVTSWYAGTVTANVAEVEQVDNGQGTAENP